ncbi:MAG: AraC family transcriptional regulator [Nitrincola lacisaponensis]|uniref:Transcriptional regulator, AraC family n=1 Tax=Nitrincola lacisaponensis TaxID=267850 RepID=A0A063Y5W9_9GAMM|nr:AraC family transcriptional regulator [Nitrincola lacisaponensis]KDE40525.1 Transcriptional regulator, AraC family [Nitrincola lacisaponensis]
MEKTITVPTGYVRHLLFMAESQGFDTDDLLRHVDISREEMAENTGLPAYKFGLLYQHIMWIAQDESFGMLSGGRVPNGTFRMMCHAIIHCTTLERALRRCSDFYEICRGSMIKPVLVRRGRYAKVSFAPIESLSPADFEALMDNESPLQIRTSLSMWHHFMSWLIGRRLELKAAYFHFADPGDADQYVKLFQSEVKFSQHEDAIVFPAHFLDLPLAQNEESLRGFLKTAPYQLIVMVDDDKSLKARVISMLGKDFSRELPSAEEVARALHMSVSTLRRRLLEEGTSYQKIKDDERRAAAINYMNSPQLSINDVAGLMGFDEPSAFFRSFKKWTGMTPGEYRRSTEYTEHYR